MNELISLATVLALVRKNIDEQNMKMQNMRRELESRLITLPETLVYENQLKELAEENYNKIYFQLMQLAQNVQTQQSSTLQTFDSFRNQWASDFDGVQKNVTLNYEQLKSRIEEIAGQTPWVPSIEQLQIDLNTEKEFSAETRDRVESHYKIVAYERVELAEAKERIRELLEKTEELDGISDELIKTLMVSVTTHQEKSKQSARIARKLYRQINSLEDELKDLISNQRDTTTDIFEATDKRIDELFQYAKKFEDLYGITDTLNVRLNETRSELRSVETAVVNSNEAVKKIADDVSGFRKQIREIVEPLVNKETLTDYAKKASVEKVVSDLEEKIDNIKKMPGPPGIGWQFKQHPNIKGILLYRREDQDEWAQIDLRVYKPEDNGLEKGGVAIGGGGGLIVAPPAGSGNVVKRLYNMTGFSFFVPATTHLLTDIISYRVLNQSGIEVGVVSEFVGSSIRINSNVNLTNHTLVLLGTT